MPDPAAPPLLDVSGVTRRFGGLVANKDVSFTLAEGEILGLIGPNGAGKTTIFNILAGAVRPNAGRVRFAGRNITGLPPNEICAAGIGRTFQVVRSFESMTVLENVMVGGFNRTARTTAARHAALEMLHDTGLYERRDAPARALTPPEKRRLEIARALATQPRLLLLDEALTGLNAAEARIGVALIRAVRARGVSVLMVEHVMEILMPLVDRVVVMHLGEVLTTGLPGEVVRDPAVIAAYLGDRYAARG